MPHPLRSRQLSKHCMSGEFALPATELVKQRAKLPGRPFHADSLRDDHLHPLGQVIGIVNLGWYAFRHTYRTLLDDLGTPVGVQQKLMRHSDIRTTMNVYGSAYEQSKRQANERVAGKLLEQIEKPAAKQLMQ
jgi:integrase